VGRANPRQRTSEDGIKVRKFIGRIDQYRSLGTSSCRVRAYEMV